MSTDLDTVRKRARSCKACPLWKNATQTVFGEGKSSAKIFLIGEQPGDQEDKEGHPFVGPAGRLLDRALAEAGIDRDTCYVTNAVNVSGYTERALSRWASRLRKWAKTSRPRDAKLIDEKRRKTPQIKDVFVYFDNDVKVRAPADAKRLREILLKSRKS